MSTNEKFENAQNTIKNLKERPSNDELLNLYALYKQGTVGNVEGKRPGMLNIKERAKFDAWADKKGQDGQLAMDEYVSLVESLVSKYGTN